MRYNNQIFGIIFSLCVTILLVNCQQEPVYKDKIYEKPIINPDPPAPMLSPEESRRSIYLPEGFKLELVASEPMIEEPIAIAFDGDGKMYVAELLTYMQDIDGTNTNEPWSRVSLLEDTNGDGKMDKSTVFVDSLILPRNLLPLDDRVIISETYSRNFYSYRDTNGDGVADEKKLVYADSTRFKGNLEHQAANLTWNIDNRMYLSRRPYVFRWENGKMLKDTLLDSPEGQYGLTQDENGKLFYSRAGGEVVASNFQQHAVYGPLEMEGRWADDFEEPWPIIGTPDVQGGKKRLRPDNTLNKFTGVSGQEVFLGNRLPAYGDLFVPEPVGRLVRRAKVENINGKTVLVNPYEKTEFMASTDPNFRPVHARTGPDGSLYIVDMYRGIIQEGNWVKKGSFLRPEVERRNLDKNIGRGRIYRIVHEQMLPAKPIKLLAKSPRELVPFLGHSNGWYRFTAQKLLVVKQATSVIPSLKNTLLNNASFFNGWFGKEKDLGIERLHALWTLDGLKALDKALLIQKLADEDTRVRCAAIRLCEQYLKEGDESLFNHLYQMTADTSIEVLIQLVLSFKAYQDKEMAASVIEEIVDAHPKNEVILASSTIIPSELETLKKTFGERGGSTRKSIFRGFDIYKELCATCHGQDAMGLKGLGPALVGSPRVMSKDATPAIKILLDGLSGPIDGKDYGIMTPMKTYDDQWIADVLTYIQQHFGKMNNRSRVRTKKVKAIREKYANRDNYWTIEELKNSK